jgi:hypothetical protein
MIKTLRRLLLAPLIWLAVLAFLIEEYIWDSTARMMAQLGAFRAIHAVENRIASLSSRWAVFAFLLPSCILVPAKLVGLHAIANGHWLFGSIVFVLAKIAGMALFSRIFNLTRPALMQVQWFAGLYKFVMHYRNKIHTYLDNWAAYQQAKRKLATLRYMLKGKGRLLRFLRRIRRLRQA